MQIVAWSFTNQNRRLKGTSKALLKGPQNDMKKLQKLEAISYHNFIICSLMRLKLAKVVHLNLTDFCE